MLISEALETWVATAAGARDARSSATRVLEDLGDLEVGDLSAPDVARWLRDLDRKRAWSSNRRRSFLWALRGAIQVARLAGATTHDPTRGLPRSILPRREPRPEYRAADYVLEALEIERLLRTAPSRRKAQWGVALLAGLRVGELCALQWGDVRADSPLDRLVVARNWSTRRRETIATKTRSVRRVPIHPALRALLDQHRAIWIECFGGEPGRGDLIFPRRWRDELLPQYQPQVLAAWKRDLDAIGVEARPLHSARHTFLTTAIANGADEAAAFACTHGDGSIRGIYRHWRWDSLCNAVLKIPIRKGLF